MTHYPSSPATDRPLTPEEQREALADWLEQSPTDLIAFGTGAKDVVRPDYLLATDVDWIIGQCRAAPSRPSAGSVQAPVWSSQEMVDLLDAMARSADRNTLSFTEAANIARSAADVIRWIDSEMKSLSRHDAQGSRDDVIEECAKVAEAQAQTFLSPQYASNQPFGSLCERFACDEVAKAIRALAIPSPDGKAKP